ncbi:MAG: hypothetical protein OXL96_07555 [Candidatus Poribacteria bacterium]|nr:hypothetical protein [Candidatus Poribacteria bacterium]
MNESRVLGEFRVLFNESSLINSCSGEGCNVDMAEVPSERVVVNLEHEFDMRERTEKRCDRLLFFVHPVENNLVAASIELKRGRAVESDVIEKTENSLKFIAQIVPVSIRAQIIYTPVLLEGRGVKWTNPKGAKQLKVFVHGKRLQILTGRCGRPRNLAGVLFG